MAVNQGPCDCVLCGCAIPPLGGNEYDAGRGRFGFAHPACIEAKRQGKKGRQVRTIRTSSGTFTQNVNGPCIDRPCCGC